MSEIWKPVVGYEGFYEVSNLGRVRSLDRYLPNRWGNGEKLVKGRILTQKTEKKGGYLRVHLRVAPLSKEFLVHRLVAEAFIPNPDNLPQIDHINTNRTDNKVENLRWCTAKENANNPFTLERKRITNTGSKNPMYGVTGVNNVRSTVVLQFSKDGEFIKKWDCINDIKRELGINVSNIPSCCKGKIKHTSGYIWRYHYKSLWLKNHIPLINQKKVG